MHSRNFGSDRITPSVGMSVRTTDVLVLADVKCHNLYSTIGGHPYYSKLTAVKIGYPLTVSRAQLYNSLGCDKVTRVQRGGVLSLVGSQNLPQVDLNLYLPTH